MTALDAAKKRATANFDSVKKGSSHALLGLAVKSIDEATAAADADDADDASVYAKYWLGVLLLHHILKAPTKELQELQHQLTSASEKQKDAGRAMEKVQARLKLRQMLPPPAPAQPESERNPDPSSSMGSINDRLRALREAGLADPAAKRAAHHVPKAASVSVTQSSATSPHAFVPVSSLGPPSPASNSFSSTLPTSARHHNLSNIASTSASSSAAASTASSPTFSMRSEQDFTTNFPSIDELEASFSFPSVPTSPPGSSTSPAFNGLGYSAFSSPPPSTSSGPRSSRSHSIASTSRITPTAPSTSASVSPTPPDTTRSSRAPSASSATRIQKPEPPKPTDISPRELKATLDSHLKVLLLDVRNRDEYERKHINGSGDAVVCIEPSILLREQVTSQAIESALVVGPNQDLAVFRNRGKFDVVVIYDEKTESVAAASPAISRLIRAIYDDELVQRLKTAPRFLAGGLQAWAKEFATEVVVAQASVTPAVAAHKTPPEVPRHTKPLVSALSMQSPTSPAFFDARPPAVSVVPSSAGVSPAAAAVSYPSALPNGTGPSADHAAAATATPVGYDVTGQSDTRPPESPVTETVRRLNRKPTISRPPSAGPMSAYRRTAMHDMQLSPTASTSTSSPIQYPSPIRAFSPQTVNQSTTSLASSLLSSHDTGGLVQAPPTASVSSSPLARRRSDYIEQSQMPYAGAPAASVSSSRIDYPQVIRPPPPVARQDQRPLPPPKPPLIASDYPVMSWSEMQVATSGLKNLGNTCYMNATIQCLSATVPFARFFTDGRWKTAVNMVNPLGTKGQLANAFATLLHEMWHGDLPYRSPYAFRKTVCASAKQFANSEQHDCQEFLSALLDGLHEDLNRIIAKPAVENSAEREAELETLAVQIASEQEWQIYQMRNDSLIVDYFQGQFRNRVQCLTCHKTSTTYNSFMYLSLPIPAGRGVSKVSLTQCLDHFVREEVIDKENAWNCPNCKCPRRATTQLSLSRLPPVLLIHLKRFSVKGPFTDKLETVVDFPQRGLDLTNYMPPPLPPGTARPSRAGPPLRADDPRIQVPPYKYDLYAVTNHYGTLTGGHYTALIASRGGWLHCDDSRISEADPQSLTTRAYVLFYRRCM